MDAIRATAAFAVMFGHWRGFFFVDYGHVAAHNLSFLVKAFYALSGFGHQAVMVFFVLSGFFISSSILRSMNAQTWSWQDYAIDRGVRLYVVLIPGLLLGLLWDFLGLTLVNRTGIYSAPLVPFGARIPANTLTWEAFVGNVLFLQTRFVPVFGSNGPLWSLFNEFWYYILFPALLAAVLAVRNRSIARSTANLILATVTVWVLGGQLIGFLVWLAGCGVALGSHYFAGPSARTILYCSCAAVLSCVCLVSSRGGSSWLGSDLAVGLSFALLLGTILQIRAQIGTFSAKIARTLAGFSFSLYVLHFPVLLFIRASWMPTSRWQPDGVHLFYGSMIGIFTLLYAFAVSRITESNTPLIRAWFRTRLRLRAPQGSAQMSGATTV